MVPRYGEDSRGRKGGGEQLLCRCEEIPLTCFSSIKDDLINAGAEYVDREVVRDGNVISSRGPDDLGAFCREIIQCLAGR
jgi:putative intracellular protease/amidase